MTQTRNKLAFMSSTISMAAQIIYLLINFVVRRFFIRYFGMEILGINGVIVDVLNTLSLADLGVQSAIMFRLYEPLAKGRTSEVSEIITLFRKVYWGIGCFIVAGGLVCMPFLRYLMKDLTFSMGYVRVAFLLQLLISASTYFLAYKRTLLYADQKQHINSLVDIGCNLVFVFVKFFVIIVVKDYYIYLISQIVQNVISNLIVHVICKKEYPFLDVRGKVSSTTKKNLWYDVKNVFASKLATYIYGSTDNLVISSFISTLSVGYLSSYKYVTSCLMSIVYYMMVPILPMIGNYLVDEDLESSKRLFRNYTFIRYFLAVILLVPAVCLADNFVAMWIGEENLMTPMITYLLVADTYVSIVYGPTGEYISARGLFEKEKKVMLLAAFLNITLSIAGTFVLGIYGVLLGTVVCQLVLWIGKSTIVFRNILSFDRREIAGYWLGQIKDLFVFCAVAGIGKRLTGMLFAQYSWTSFLVNGAVLVLISALAVSIFNFRTSGYAYLLRIGRMVLDKVVSVKHNEDR